MDEFFEALDKAVKEKIWSMANAREAAQQKKLERRGITGIESVVTDKALRNKGKISEAFEDINALISAAKPMVQLIHKISNSIKVKDSPMLCFIIHHASIYK
jgi:hypothetical protein